MEEKAYYDEINLGKYIETLFRQWRLIFIVPFLCALIAGIVSVLMPKTYEASVLIASTRNSSEVSFGSEIETLSEDSLLAAGNSGVIDASSRLQSYAQMIKNPSIAEAVINQIGEKLPSEERDIATILEMVGGEVVENSDAVRIKLTHQDPVLAAELANLWGQNYIAYVNGLYSNFENIQLTANVEAQVVEARVDYEEAQTAYENYLATSQKVTLAREIQHLQSSIDILEAARDKVYRQKMSEKTLELTQYYDDLLIVKGLKGDAEAMLQQLQIGGEGAVASNRVALILLKMRAFAYPRNSDDVIELQISTESQAIPLESALADLQGMVTVLADQEEDIRKNIQTLESEILANEELEAQEVPIVDTILKLEEQFNLSQSQFIQEKAQEMELQRDTDLAWETYDNLKTKLEELKVEAQTTSGVVLLAVPASVPNKDTVSGIKNIALAIAIGLILGVASAYFIEFWWNYKDTEPEPIVIRTLFRK